LKGGAEMRKEILDTNKVPQPVGPYSQVVRYGNLIFISGQISVDFSTGAVIKQDIAGQTSTIMSIIKQTLEDVGSSIDKILKCSVHLSDASHFSAMNEVYATFFTNNYPARITVSGVQLYDGVDVEIDVIAGI